jgi:hypothetical protein
MFQKQSFKGLLDDFSFKMIYCGASCPKQELEER